jgi:integrase
MEPGTEGHGLHGLPAAAQVRGHGEGSIYQRKDGLWAGVVDHGRVNGKRQRSSYYGKTRREVHARLLQVLEEKRRGMAVIQDRRTVDDFMRSWLSATRASLRPRTWQRYEEYVRVHALPFIGTVRLMQLQPEHLRTLYANRLEAGLSTSSVGHLHAVLHVALAQVERDSRGRIPNVARLVQPPRVERREMAALSPAEARTLLAAAADDRLEALYDLALATGARQGELLALRWSDIDMEPGVIRIQRTLVRAVDGLSFAEPKTGSSRRSIPIGKGTVERLRVHRRIQLEERMALGTTWGDADLVFANSYGRPIDAGHLLREDFYPLLNRAGLRRVRFHDLRHTAATLMLAQGVHPKVVSERLGHSTPMLTLTVYSHVTQTMQRESADKLDALLHGGA